MGIRILKLQFFLMMFFSGYAQKATLDVKLFDNSSKNSSEFIFRVKITNSGFDHYWIQDTGYLAQEVEYPHANLIYTILSKKVNGKYIHYENLKHRPGTLRDKCMDSCCNCIFLNKGRTLTFDLKLLQCCTVTEGEYKMQVYIHAPTDLCDRCDQIEELVSPSIYFAVGEKSK
jgi:hypothetical protein